MKAHRRSLLVVAALATISAACGDVTAGGMNGPVRAVAVGDGSPPSSSMSPESGAAQQTGQPAHDASASEGAILDVAAAPRGRIDFTAEVTLISETGTPFRLTTVPATANVTIEGTDFDILIERRIPVGSYTTARVVFTNVSADVQSGLVVNGVPFLGPLSVDLGAAGSTTVEVPITLEVEPAFTSTVLIDLRASAWLPAVNVLARTVPVAAFQSAVRVSVQ